MQLSFNFPFEDKYLLEDFIVSSCNFEALNFIQHYDPKDANTTRLTGIIAPRFAGKTYLAKLWQKKLMAEFLDIKELFNANLFSFIEPKKFYIIDDVDKIKNQELLLQIINLVEEKSAFLLLTSSVKLINLGLKIKDLNSRLKNIFQLEISQPGDDLIMMLLIKNFASKQLKVESEVINFLVKNLDRSFDAVFNIVKILEFCSSERKKNITINLVKEVLKKNQPIDL